MTDNVTTPISGTTFATDDISGIHYPLGKITLGADGVNDGTVSATNPLPVTISSALGIQLTVQQLAAMTPEQVAALTLSTLATLDAGQISALTMPATFNGARATASTLTNIAAVTTATAGNLAASNTSRKKIMIFNDSTANLFIAFGAIATTSAFSIKLLPQDTVILDFTYQAISGVWDAANGTARVTNFT